jgi:hypothetical protein
MKEQQLFSDFTAGELAPAFKGRPDLQLYNRGASLVTNCIPQIPCGFAFRGGLYRAADNLHGKCVLVPFIISSTVAYILEVGFYGSAGYIRYWLNGELVKSGGPPVESATTYAEADLPALCFAQTSNQIIITHRGYAPRSVTWDGANFSFGTITIAGNAGQVPFQSAGNYPGICAFFNGRLYLASTTNATTTIWASRPYDFEDFTFFDTITTTTKQLRDPIRTWTGNCTNGSAEITSIAAATVTALKVGDRVTGTDIPTDTFIQAKGTTSITLDKTATGAHTAQTFTSYWHDNSIPEYEDVSTTRDVITEGNAFVMELASDQNEQIVGLVAAKDLIVRTTSGERVIPTTITAVDLSCVKETGYGSAAVQAFLFERSMVMVEAGGRTIREYRYTKDGYESPELTFHARSLFESSTIIDIDYQNTPIPTIWAVLASGEMRGCVYSDANGIAAWFRLTTVSGTIESLAVVPGTSGDDLYVSVLRGSTRSMEKLVTTCHLDNCRQATKSAGKVTGITWITGAATVVYNNVHYDVTVAANEATLPSAIPDGSTVYLGKEYTGTVTTMPTQMETPLGPGPMRKRTVTRAIAKVLASYPFKAGTAEASLEQAKFTGPATGDYTIPIRGNWDTEGCVIIRMDEPFDLTVLAVAIEIDTGG